MKLSFKLIGMAIIAVCMAVPDLPAQISQQQVDAQLSTMSEQEIDAKLREIGLTRQQAEERANAMGLDVSAYLRRAGVGATEVKADPVDLSTPAAAPLPQDADAGTKPPPRWYMGADGLEYFGYKVFDGIPAAFEPTASGPADPEYLIGPEDGLRLVVWGQAEFQYDLTVDREGRIFIPTVGQILVSGLSLERAYDKLLKTLSRSYSGLVGANPTVWMDLTISKLRPKRIFVIGEIRKPGGYTVHSYSTIFNSLYSVGGPTIRGSLRDVRVLRNNKIVHRIDLYDYFTGSESTNDIRIQTNDQIFVPIRGKTVALRGQIKHPAIFELKEGETFKDLLRFAGGFTSEAYLEKIKIRRILPVEQRVPGQEERIELDIDYLQAVKAKKPIELQDGDEVIIRSILDDRENFVTLTGAVYRPGTYQREKFPTLRSLIVAADSTRREVYTGRVEVSRLLDDLTRAAYHLDLDKIMDPASAEFPLEDLDEVHVYSVVEIRETKETFEVRGQVRSPGTFDLIDNTSLLDALFKAGGLQDNAHKDDVVVVRRRNANSPVDTLSYSITVPICFWKTPAEHMTIDSTCVSESAFLLQDRDIVVVQPDPHWLPQRLVSIGGEVTEPGTYALTRPNVRLSDILKQAGGVKKTGFLAGARLNRDGVPVRVEFSKAIRDPNGDEDVILSNGDAIYVPLIPNSVRIAGEVGNPGIYGFVKGRSLNGYIDVAGGLKDSAQYVYLSYPSGLTEKFSTGWFSSIFQSNPTIEDGSSIQITRRPPDPPGEEVDIGKTVTDVMAILASTLTILVLANRL